MEIREYCQKELNTLWDETRRLVNPHQVYVDLSSKLYHIKIQLLDQMGQVQNPEPTRRIYAENNYRLRI